MTRGGEEEEHAKHQGHIEPALPDPLCMDAGLEPVLNVAPNSALVPFVPIASRTRSSLEGHEVPRSVPSVPKASKKKRVRTGNERNKCGVRSRIEGGLKARIHTQRVG